MTRPSFQFYPADWRANAKLRRCTDAERGVWIDAMCLLHDAEEYGVLRWPLKDLAQAIGCKVSSLRALREKGVLKGADVGETCSAFTYAPRHAGREGDTVVLLPEQKGPIWYSSRMVKDEYIRTLRATNGAGTNAPKPPIGVAKGDHLSRDARAHPRGRSSSSSSSASPERAERSRGSRLPPDWTPDAEQIAFCRAERPDLDPAATAARFVDYWIAQPGAKGVKVDWTATWRNWVRGEKAAPGNVASLPKRAPPCGNCAKPLTGGYTNSPKGMVCNPCWLGYMAGAWPEKAEAA